MPLNLNFADLLEFEDSEGSFIGDNVFETTFLLRGNEAPLIYEVSGPYDVISNEYATIGRIYENGKRIFECDIKSQIQERTAAMLCLFFKSLGHIPQNILIIGFFRTTDYRPARYFLLAFSFALFRAVFSSVSYTHLTLPTILLV